ncbi:MAG: hypothetical protein KC502_15220 [Myxococcales bacterium]|nr:hypothetical protein [Myxococcales bacterium]
MSSADDFNWDLGTPLDGDRAIAQTSDKLAGRHIALCVTGGIAAYRIPTLARELRRAGAEVTAWVTPTALQFVTRDALRWTTLRPVVGDLDGRAQHVESASVDLWLVAPATYSTINKMAQGIADNALTTALASAIGRVEAGQTQILIAPTMHGTMANSILRASLARLANLGCRVITPRARDGKALLPEDADLLTAVMDALPSQAS